MKILLVDDNAMIRKSFSHFLSFAGHTITTAENGHDACDRIAENIPDLIICDLMMPEISGVSFIQIIRDYLHYNIPIIVISTLDKGKTISEHLGKNIEFMPKPVLYDELLQKVNTYSKI
ncbi:MAG TPA: response regulator [Bacteroidia bacterium]